MRIKKFNESIIKKNSPFTNQEMMKEWIAPILKYDFTRFGKNQVRTRNDIIIYYLDKNNIYNSQL